MLTITHMSVWGGLGNQLFKLAALEHISKKTGRTMYLTNLENKTPHSRISYMDTIFQNWKHLYRPTFAPSRYVVSETTFLYQEWDVPVQHMVIDGYMQDWQYVDRSFCDKLTFDTSCIARHPGIQDTVFLHIRGGDYVGHVMHDVGLDAYYAAAIAQFPPETRFSIFTNDKTYAQTKLPSNLSYSFIDENDIDSLFLMSKCAGGICANSSFSWWGAYLNPSRKLILPSKWYAMPGFETAGYYFPGVIML